MKIKLLLGIAALTLTIFSCTKEEDDTVFTAQNAKISNQIDRIADDISAIAEEEYANQEAAAGRIGVAESTLPSCATITTTFTADTFTSTINFGETGCTLQNGNILTGQIIISGSTDFTQTSHEINYSFNNFYHNNSRVEGNRHVTFTWESTPAQAAAHTVADIDLDFTVTYPNGKEYHRAGHRIRELIAGYDTPLNWLDNVYQITGSWSTVFPGGTFNTTIGNPLVYFASCPYIGQGTLNFSTASNSATLDYGDGVCDYFATLVVNGGSEDTVNLN